MKIAVIDDDPDIVEALSLCFNMRWPDARVVTAGEGLAGLEMVERENPDIVILDIVLPDIDGFEVCRRIRLFSDVPVIILTVKDQELHKVKGLELGADDYMTKPFSHVEFLARVKAVMRRSSIVQTGDNGDPITIGRLRIDFSSREVWVNGSPVRLTPIEYNLLQLLARNAGRVMPHRVLLERIWGANYVDSTDYLKVYIQRLRSKLNDGHHRQEMIVSERGVGYRMNK